jgi:hypothetical protein
VCQRYLINIVVFGLLLNLSFCICGAISASLSSTFAYQLLRLLYKRQSALGLLLLLSYANAYASAFHATTGIVNYKSPFLNTTKAIVIGTALVNVVVCVASNDNTSDVLNVASDALVSLALLVHISWHVHLVLRTMSGLLLAPHSHIEGYRYTHALVDLDRAG